MNHTAQNLLLIMTTLLLAGAIVSVWVNPLVGMALFGFGLTTLFFTILPSLDGR